MQRLPSELDAIYKYALQGSRRFETSDYVQLDIEGIYGSETNKTIKLAK